MKKPIPFVGAIVLFTIGLLLIVNYQNFYVTHREDREEEEYEEKESGVDKQMSMWFQARAYPDPYYLGDKYEKGWEQANALRNQSMSRLSNLTTAQWRSIGPSANIGGRILSIAINPVKSTSLIAGSAGGGMWKSNDGGSSWSPITTQYPVLGVASVIYNPSDTNIVYAGTGEVYRIDSTGTTPNPGNTGYNVWKTRGTYGVGILKSSDGGKTWTRVLSKSMANLFAIQMLKFDPTNANTVYACATDGLYRSTNGGSTWTNILSKTYVSDVVINAKNTNQIVASVGNLGNTDKGIYRSADGGGTWSKITSGLPASFNGFIRMDNVPSLGNRDTIVASIGVSEASGVNELYRSEDFGSTWSVLSSSTHCQWQYWCAHDVAINPSSTGEFVYGGVNLYAYTIKTTVKQNGTTNTTYSSGSTGSTVHDDIHDIKFDPTLSNTVYVCCDGGVYKSTDGGSTFTSKNNGLAATQFYASLGVSATDPNLFVGGLQDNGQVVYNGTSWTTVGGVGGDGTACAIDPSNDNKMVVSRDARGIYASTNRGGSATGIAAYWGSTYDSRTAFCAPVAYAKSNPSIIYAASDNLHVSTNLGTFTYNSGSTATNYIDAKNKTAIALAVSPTNANKLYVSTSNFAQYDNDVDNIYVTGTPNVLKTTTGGTPFTSIMGTGANTLPNRFIMDFAISTTNDDSVFVAVGGFGTSHVYVSGDGGLNWKPAGGGLPDVPFNAVLIDPANPKVLYAGGDMGVYVSPDRGSTWYDYNNGFWDVVQVMDLQVAADGAIVVATHGKGVFVGAAYSGTPLPVRITAFTGVHQSGVNKLEWTTEQEINFSKYVLERSFDGAIFITAATIAPLYGGGIQHYHYLDNVASLQPHNMYYRLKLVDIDGSVTYTKVVAVEKPLLKEVTFLGNPFTSKTEVFVKPAGSTTLTLYDLNGRVLRRKAVQNGGGNSSIVLNGLEALPSGMYIMEAIVDNRKYTEKVVKN